MKQNRINIGRRDFVKAGSLAVVSAAIAGGAGKAAAQAPTRLDENDAQAHDLLLSAAREIRRSRGRFEPGRHAGCVRLDLCRPACSAAGRDR